MDFKLTGIALVALAMMYGCASSTGGAKDQDAAAASSAAPSAAATAATASTAGAVEPEIKDPQVLPTSASVDDPDEVVCKRIQKTGSRVKTRVCATRAQWDEAAKQAAEATERLQSTPLPGRPAG